MGERGKLVATIYQSKAERSRDSQEIERVKEMTDDLCHDGIVDATKIESIATVARDDDADEIHTNWRETELANRIEDWRDQLPKDAEILFMDRGVEYSELDGARHKIRFDTPFVTIEDDGQLIGAFPSQVGDQPHALGQIPDILNDERDLYARGPAVTEVDSSGSPEHDGWRDYLISESESILGDGWQLEATPEFKVTASECMMAPGWIDVVFRHQETSQRWLIDIKPNPTREEVDRGIGQLYRYLELYSQQERVYSVQPEEIKLGIAAPQLNEGQRSVLCRAGIEPVPLLQ